MKFFDLEICDCLTKIPNKKGKGRDISYAEGGNCSNYKFTNGHNFLSCAGNWWDNPELAACETSYQSIYGPYPADY